MNDNLLSIVLSSSFYCISVEDNTLANIYVNTFSALRSYKGMNISHICVSFSQIIFELIF